VGRGVLMAMGLVNYSDPHAELLPVRTCTVTHVSANYMEEQTIFMTHQQCWLEVGMIVGP
jgi:hypothetical protein